MRVLLLSRYGRMGASSRLRSYQYVPFLESYGLDITVASLFDEDYLQRLYDGRSRNVLGIAKQYMRRLRYLLSSRRFDLVWIEKELFPWLPAWGVNILRGLSVPYVVDYDDAVFHNYDNHSSKLVRMSLGGKIDAVMRHAAMVIAGNDYLADRARKAGARRVVILPTVIDLEKYPVPQIPRAGGHFTIGWIGSPITAKYLQTIRDPLIEFSGKYDVKLVVIGAEGGDFGRLPVETHAWTEDTEVERISCFDVGIMPLPDSPWHRGKCGYKLIQYMACGRPVIASPVGVNREIVKPGKTGFLATTTSEWLYALTEVILSEPLRSEFGAAARKTVEEHYCIQKTAPQLLSLLRSAATE